jgi:hypothetical protein
MEAAFQLPCTNEFCTMLFQEFNDQKLKMEQQKIENEVLRISLKDCTTSNESVIHELRRLLDKETGLVNILNSELIPDPTGIFPSCANCMHYRQQSKLVREANAQEYRWVVHFAKLSKNLRLELQEALISEKTKHSQLKSAYDELHTKKTDPLCRDSEIARLRAELQEAKQNHLNANQTAYVANRVTETLQKELQIAQQRVAELEIESSTNAVRIKTLEEIVETCRRAEELRDCSIGQCKDYVCIRRVLDLYAKEKEYRVQIDMLQREQAYHLNTITQLRRESEQWRTMTSDAAQPMVDVELLPVAVAKKDSKTPLVADLANMNELRMNIQSLFTIFAAWFDENMDEAGMFADFLADVAPTERAENMRWLLASCHGGAVPVGIKDEDLNAGNKFIRKCFSACIRALGGVSRKIGSKVIWVNVRRNRKPIFLKT